MTQISRLVGVCLSVTLGLSFLAQPLRSQDRSSDNRGSVFPPDTVFHDNSVLRIESIAVHTDKGENIAMGDQADPAFIAKTNILINRDTIAEGLPLLQGYSDGKITIGWSERGSIVYIELRSRNAATSDGLRIGMSRKEVLSAVGTPYAETSSFLRYENIDFEEQGLLFLFDKRGIVSKIILFAYI